VSVIARCNVASQSSKPMSASMKRSMSPHVAVMPNASGAVDPGIILIGTPAFV
jgi:membrane-bound lytic murein transglycosylase